jgi:hypothetical protein
MKRRTWTLLAATAQIVVLAGCVPTVMGPTVSATPGPGKLPADFAGDHAACAAQANQQMAPVVQAANNQVAGTALQNLLTGTGNDAAALNAQATTQLQQQYDNTYSACMYAKGDNVPPYYMQPVYYAEPAPAATHRAKRRVAQKHTTPPAATASAPAAVPAATSGFVVPPPTAPAAGAGFVTPAPAAPPTTSFAQSALPSAGR